MADTKYLTVSLTDKDIKRIFSKISINLVTGCWEWNRSVTVDGYSQLWFDGKMNRAHRIIYAYMIEPLPIGKIGEIPVLDHICKNRSCCNPYHLVLVTSQVNSTNGDGFAAVNKRKTHCKEGHKLPDTPNTNKGKSRRCWICLLEKSRKQREDARRVKG